MTGTARIMRGLGDPVSGNQDAMTQVAVVVHEGKLAALRGPDLRALLRAALTERGEPPPREYATSDADAGTEVTRTALAEGAQLVVVCGGDGTVSACAAALAGTGVPMAVVPAGTGNLVAGNLGLPREPQEAVAVALDGVDRRLDLGRIGDGVVVGMAGLGLDAAMVQDAPHALKRRLGWPAYVVSLLRHLRDRHLTLVLDVDGDRTVHRNVAGVVVGNMGQLHGGLALFPDAQPDDGLLDVVVIAPRGIRGWVAGIVDLLRGKRNSSALQRRRGRRIVVTGERPMRREADGDALPDDRVMDVAVEPGALLLRTPAENAG
ncbi:MAG: diacylglycerol kinase [Catenulispora sp.]|nr:diacylglycerol kinase [Catenulispora sp.]